MPAVVPILAVASIAGTAYGAIAQKQAADNAAQIDSATAAYNAKYDTAMAQQLDEDTQANIRTERQDDAVYLSRQAASYASAGVLANTGSALDAQITNAGRFEQKIQQDWVNSNQKQLSYYSQAQAGLAYGAAQAEADRMSGSIALINGGTQLARMAFTDYTTGVFGGGGKNNGLSGPTADIADWG